MITKLNNFLNESNFEILTGIIQKDGSVIAEDGTIHWPGTRGADREGYPEVLIDAKSVGGGGSWGRQSIKPYIGMSVKFVRHGGKKYQGYNFEIIPNKPVTESVRDLMKPKPDEDIKKDLEKLTSEEKSEKLVHALEYSDDNIIRMLLKSGAKLSTNDFRNKTAQNNLLRYYHREYKRKGLDD